MRFKTLGIVLLLLQATAAFANQDEVKTRLGAELDVGIFQSSGTGAKDSKANSGLKQHKADVFFHFESGKVKAMIQVDLLNLGIVSTSKSSTTDATTTPVTTTTNSTARALDE
jgi:hypothetical protein